MYLLDEFSIIPLLVLLSCWLIGGWLIVRRFFHVPADEQPLLGLGLGLVFSTWATNLLSRVADGPAGFWAAPVIFLLLGVASAYPLTSLRDSIKNAPWLQLLFFIATAVIFTLIGRGFGFFDDHQNLPALSMMAAGDVPPHFAFNPSLMFGYHYFLLLTGACFVRLADAAPWAALDLARGITLALTFFYAGFVARRLTNNLFVQITAMLFTLFAGGARWILLLLPANVLQFISRSITLIGSGADSGPNLATTLLKNWNIEGQGPFPLPFMYGSGLDPSFSMFHNGWGTSAIMMILIVLLLARSISNRKIAYLPFVVLFSSMALANEVTFAFFYVGFIITVVWVAISQRSFSRILEDKDLIGWFIVLVAAGLIALVQGGMLTEIFCGFFRPASADGGQTYFKVSFALGWPSFLSSHLGKLSLIDPRHWLPILGETGLVILALPLAIAQFQRNIKEKDWISSAWQASLFASLAMVFFSYTGNAGPTAVSRMQAHFLTVLKITAIPLGWLWLRGKSDQMKGVALAIVFAAVFSGISLFGLQLSAMSQPTNAIYLSHLDSQMFKQQWNKLEQGAMVFDPVYPRAATVLGRPIRSSITMGETLPEWNMFFKQPDPYALQKAGYGYLYVDQKYLQKHASSIVIDCVVAVETLEELDNGFVTEGRYLYDIRACQ